MIEHESEKTRQIKLLDEVLDNGDRIPLRQLFSMTEYPKDMHNVMKLYAEGYSVSDYLVQQGGPRKFLSFMEQAHQDNWDKALKNHYNIDSIEALEKYWTKWTVAGSPRLSEVEAIAKADPPTPTITNKAEPDTIVRGQSPEPTPTSNTRTLASNSSRSKPDRYELMLPVMFRED